MAARLDFSRRIAARDPSLRLYGILDGGMCARRELRLLEVARAWSDAGMQLVQYRDKTADRAALIANAVALRAIFPEGAAFLLLNDHPDLVPETGFDGAHVGQSDADPAEARHYLRSERILGISSHTPDQASAVSGSEADYVAVGPVYSTATKADAKAVGLCGVLAARAVTTLPLVAIGGITAERGRQVLSAGADTVAVIAALLPSAGTQSALFVARDFMARLK